MRRFNNLNVPDHWQHYWSKYPNGYSILESLMDWVSQVNEMVGNQNELNKSMEEFIKQFDNELAIKIVEKLNEWILDGSLAEVINEQVFSNLSTVVTSISEPTIDADYWFEQKSESLENIQIKHKEDEVWKNIYPITNQENIFDSEGKALPDVIYAIKNDITEMGLDLTNAIEELGSGIGGNIVEFENEVNSKFTDLDSDISDLNVTVADIKDKYLLNVRDYGAKGDGVTDDTVAIQNCINAVSANLKKNITGAIFPNGKYKITNINVPAGVSIIGNFTMDGITKRGTWLYCVSRTTAAVTLNSGSAIRGMGFYYPEQGWNDTTSAPLYAYPGSIKIADDVRRILIEDICFLNAYYGIDASNHHELLWIRNVQGYCIYRGIEIDHTTDIDRINTMHLNYNVLMVTGDANAVKYRNWTRKNGNAFILKKCDWILINDFFAWGYRRGIYIDTSVNGGVDGAKFINSGCDNVGNGIVVTSSHAGTTHSGITFENCYFTGFNQYFQNEDTDNVITVNNVSTITFKNCRFWACEKSVFNIVSADFCLIDGCMFESYGTMGIANAEVYRAVIHLAGRLIFTNNTVLGRNILNIQGLFTNAGSAGVIITNNFFHGFNNDMWSIVLEEGSNYQIMGNIFPNSTAQILRNGISPSYTIGESGFFETTSELSSRRINMTPISANSPTTKNNTIFVDSADNLLKYKNNAGTVLKISVTA